MIEALLMLAMLAFVFLLLLQSRRLTDKSIKNRRLLEIFEFKLTLDGSAKAVQKKGSLHKKRG